MPPSNKKSFSHSLDIRLRKLYILQSERWYLVPCLLFILSVIVFSSYGFNHKMGRDEAIYMYSGQQFADGTPPYVSIFDHKGPIAPMIIGFGVVFSQLFGLSDIYTVRILFLFISTGSVVALYYLAKQLFRSEWVGIFAALTFLGFYGFALHAAARGPRAKTPMVLFLILSLYFTSKKSWFWAGFFGSLSCLTWQPTGILPVITIVLAGFQRTGERWRALKWTFIGVAVPSTAIILYYAYYGALDELIMGLITFNILYLERQSRTLLQHFGAYPFLIFESYIESIIPFVFGSLLLVRYYWNVIRDPKRWSVLFRSHLSVYLLTFPLFFIYLLIDPPGYTDYYLILPYIAISFALFIHISIQNLPISLNFIRCNTDIGRGISCVLLIIIAGMSVAHSHLIEARTLENQRDACEAILERYGTNARIVTIGAPQVLVHLHRTNPTRYVFVTMGVDNLIDSETGGFEGWIEELEGFNPDIIVLGRTFGGHTYKLIDWLEAEFTEDTDGPWTNYDWRLFIR